MPLTYIAIRQAKATEKPFKLSDGGGLHLLVTPTGGKLWRLAYRFDGKQRQLASGNTFGLISAEYVTRLIDEGRADATIEKVR